MHQPDSTADAVAAPPVSQAKTSEDIAATGAAAALAEAAQVTSADPVIDDTQIADPVDVNVVVDQTDGVPVAAPAIPQDAIPSFSRTERAPRISRVPMWQWAALALLTAALGIQMLIADRARLAQDAIWRPVLERACGMLRCTLPAWHQPQAYTMLARDVKPVPAAPGVLQVRATFRNDARWPQRWPSIALSLSDADGRVAGARVLVPSDYLASAQRDATLAPGQNGQMTVQLREPSGGVVAFAFEFR